MYTKFHVNRMNRYREIVYQKMSLSSSRLIIVTNPGRAMVTYGAFDFKFALIVHIFEPSVHVYEYLDLQN